MKAMYFARAALLSCAVALVLSCGDSTPTGVAPTTRPAADETTSLLGLSLLRCTPMPAAQTTQTIGPDGGTIRVGPHTLRIPAGALAAPTTITGVAPSDTVNSVVFSPDGLVFNRPVKLIMSYANCRGLGMLLPKQIVHTTPNLLVILEILQSVDNILQRRVSASLGHFSTYAVAW